MVPAILVAAFVVACGGEPDTPATGGGAADDPTPTLNITMTGPARLWLLTNEQYTNTVTTLFEGRSASGIEGLTTPEWLNTTVLDFRNTDTDRFSTRATSYTARSTDLPDLHDAAVEIASRLSAQLGKDSCLSLGGDLGRCLGTIIQEKGGLLFRRPLTPTEVQGYVDFGLEVHETTGDKVQSIEYALRALLAAPQFLYRSEMGAVAPGAAASRRQLTPFEVASALSYTLMDGPPDQPLWDAAVAGRLKTAEQVRTQVLRLLAQPTTLAPLERFIEEYFKYTDVVGASKLHDFHDEDAVLADTRRLVQTVIAQDFEGDLFGALLTTKVGFASPSTAANYGLKYYDAGTVEAEAFDANSPAAPFVTTNEGGRVIVVWPGTDGANIDAADDAPGQLFYTIVASESTLKLYATANLPNANDDSFHYKLDGKDDNWSLQNATSTNGFKEIEIATWNGLDIGKEYTLKIQRREDGAKLDAFRITGGEFENTDDASTLAMADADAYVFMENPEPESGLTRITFPETSDRLGILGQPSWLAAFSHPDHTDVIRRGRFIFEAFSCGVIPDAAIPVVPPLSEDPNLTMREKLALHTEQPSCAACHSVMDPMGFGLEGFDEVGRARDEEIGRPINTQGGLVGTTDQDGPFSGLTELTEKLLASETVRRCWVRHSFEYWMGRPPSKSDSDVASLEAAFESYKTSGYDYRRMLAALFTSDAFLYREPEDAPL